MMDVSKAKKKSAKIVNVKCPDCDGAGRWLGLEIWHDCRLCSASGMIIADDDAVPEHVDDDTTDKMWISNSNTRNVFKTLHVADIDDTDINFDIQDFILLDFDPNSMCDDDSQLPPAKAGGLKEKA